MRWFNAFLSQKWGFITLLSCLGVMPFEVTFLRKTQCISGFGNPDAVHRMEKDTRELFTIEYTIFFDVSEC